MDNKKRRPVPKSDQALITAELEKIDGMLDLKTTADVEVLMRHLLRPQVVDAMKAQGEFAEISKHVLNEAGPELRSSIRSVDWRLAELLKDGKTVFFRVPPHGLLFVKMNGKWKAQLN